MSNTEYNKSAGYLKEQETYQQYDLVDGELVPFLNIYDKGYQAREVCRRHGQLQHNPLSVKVTNASLAQGHCIQHQLRWIEEETKGLFWLAREAG